MNITRKKLVLFQINTKHFLLSILVKYYQYLQNTSRTTFISQNAIVFQQLNLLPLFKNNMHLQYNTYSKAVKHL